MTSGVQFVILRIDPAEHDDVAALLVDATEWGLDGWDAGREGLLLAQWFA